MSSHKYLELFLSEGREHVEQIARDARALSPSSPIEQIHSLFRAFHSLKGMAATMEFSLMAELAHVVEDVFDRLRKGQMAVDAEIIELSLDTAERMGQHLDAIAAGGSPQAPIDDLRERARAVLARASGSPGAGSPAAPSSSSAPPSSAPPAAAPSSAPGSAAAPAAASPAASARPAAAPAGARVRVQFEVLPGAPLPAARALVALKRLQALGAVVRCDPDPARWAELGLKEAVVVEMLTAAEPAAIARDLGGLPDIGACRAAGAGDAPQPAPVSPRPATTTVRVRTEILDRVMDGVGELMVASRVVEQRLPRAPGSDQVAQRMHRAIARLHDDALEMRMVPFDWITSRFHQAVRNLAHNLGKSVELEIRGADVQMDRAMLEELVDPINHMLRNSIDHGVEPPGERAAAGKGGSGRVLLELDRVSTGVRLALSDDGRGMDPARIRDAAVRKGFATEEQVRGMSEDEVLMLTTIPGFSTADRLTEVSGRGVGMDVVRTRIESLGGRMGISSRPGRGTCIEMILPLTVAVIDSLLLRVGTEFYAVPIQSVEQTLEVHPPQVRFSGGGAMVQWGERSVRLRTLGALLGETAEDDWSRSWSALLFEEGGRTHGLAVDAVIGKRAIVVKPLRNPLENLREYSGATVLESGRIALILDLANLARA